MEPNAPMQMLSAWFDQNAPEWAKDALANVQSIWNEGAYGLTYGQIITITGIILFSLIIRGLFARTFVRWITRLAAGTKTQMDDVLVKAIATPLKIVPVIVGVYIALKLVHIDPNAEIYANRVIQSVVTLAVFWTLARAVNAFEYAFTSLRDTLSPAVVDWMSKALQIILIILGFGAVAEQWGIAIAPLIAGLAPVDDDDEGRYGRPLSLTEAGRAVLAGGDDHVRLNGIDRGTALLQDCPAGLSGLGAGSNGFLFASGRPVPAPRAAMHNDRKRHNSSPPNRQR